MSTRHCIYPPADEVGKTYEDDELDDFETVFDEVETLRVQRKLITFAGFAWGVLMFCAGMAVGQ